MSIFARLNAINVNGHTETKGTGARALTYLSWAWAWAEVKKAYPLSYYTIYESKDGCLYHTDGRTCWVKTGVTVVDGDTQLEHIEYLPVMDNRNESILVTKVTSFDVNKAIQRSLTKACARHGLGLYIYAGEDLPEGEEPAPQPYDCRARMTAVMQTMGIDAKRFGQMRKALIDAGIVEDKPSAEMSPDDWEKLFGAILSNFHEAA